MDLLERHPALREHRGLHHAGPVAAGAAMASAAWVPAAPWLVPRSDGHSFTGAAQLGKHVLRLLGLGLQLVLSAPELGLQLVVLAPQRRGLAAEHGVRQVL